MFHPRSNVHTHTNFSDGKNSVDEMIQAAIERGFTSLGFSDHGALEVDQAAMKNEAAYREAVLSAKEKYAEQIEIALGYEHDFAAENADLSHYDYIIESVHFLRKYGKHWPIDSSAALLHMGWQDLYNENTFELYRDYYEDVSKSIEQYRPDVVGHIGLITKFEESVEHPMFDENDWKYKLYAVEPIETAAKYDTIVEINTGAMSRGYRTTPYPSLYQLKRLHELGGRITITSDCHRAEWIDYAFYKAVAHAQAAGFKTVWIWENGKFQEKSIEEA